MRKHLGLIGSLFFGLLFGVAPAAAQEVPEVHSLLTSSHPMVPKQFKEACVVSATSGAESPNCPVLKYNGYTYWAWSMNDNESVMDIVAYDDAGNIVREWQRQGARYIWNITVDTTAKTVSFIGQSNAAITLGFTDLFIPNVPNPLTIYATDEHTIACFFSTTCTLTPTDTSGAIPLPPPITGSGALLTRTYVGGAGSSGANIPVYEYRLDMTQAVNTTADAFCITDVAIDFGPQSPIPYNGPGPWTSRYDMYVVTSGGSGSIGIYYATISGNTIDFVFNQPVCAGSTPGTGQASLPFGLASPYAPRAITAAVVWPGNFQGLPTPARAPSHP